MCLSVCRSVRPSVRRLSAVGAVCGTDARGVRVKMDVRDQCSTPMTKDALHAKI